MSSTAKLVCDRESIYLSGSRCMTVCRRQLRWCVIERVFSISGSRCMTVCRRQLRWCVIERVFTYPVVGV